MYPLKIAYVMCIKMPLTFNFRILSGPIFFFIFISDLLFPHKITCIPAAPPITLYESFRALGRCAFLGKIKVFP